MRKGTEIEALRKLIVKLEKVGKKEDVSVWKVAAELLSMPRRRRVVANVGKVVKVVKDGEIALVPGKLLGDGIVEQKVKVAAFFWTPKAEARIKAAGGEVISIDKLVDENPKGTNVRIVR